MSPLSIQSILWSCRICSFTRSVAACSVVTDGGLGLSTTGSPRGWNAVAPGDRRVDPTARCSGRRALDPRWLTGGGCLGDASALPGPAVLVAEGLGVSALLLSSVAGSGVLTVPATLLGGAPLIAPGPCGVALAAAVVGPRLCATSCKAMAQLANGTASPPASVWGADV